MSPVRSLALLALIPCLALPGCRDRKAGDPVIQETHPPIITEALRARSVVPDPAPAAQCAECHSAIYEKWHGSQHANANRLVEGSLDGPAFSPDREYAHGSFLTRVRQAGESLAIAQSGPGGTTSVHHAEAVIGVGPLIQYLVPFPGGRLQTVDMAFDPQEHDWFNVYGEEDRQPHEWGFWKNRSMTWNVQCAYCHMTNLRKGYDIATDTYDTTWDAMGISCAQCHGSKEQHARDILSGAWSDEDSELSSLQKMHVCATCHARREELTGAFKVGDSFDDHYRLDLESGAGMYYLDGQVRDEVYEFGSLMMSRLSLKGVTCMHCHEPHSGELLKPVTDNSLCMTCHEAPGWNEAVVIDPVAHSHHAADSSGNRCVECHMPTTTYMARDPRRDHGFTVPDPVLTKELGIPNACNRCHEDHDADWAIDWTEKWYGERMERRSRHRARALADAQTNVQAGAEALLALAGDEEVPAWRAILMNHLGRWAHEAPVQAFLRESLTNENPLVRSAAIRQLAPIAGTKPDLIALRDDPVRLVRLDAVWRTINPLERDQAHREELMQYINYISDQPAGAVRQAQLAVVENRLDDAEPWIRKAVSWDPTSPAAQHMLGRIMTMRLGYEKAEEAFLKASELEPQSAEHPYALALMYAEMERPHKALNALRKTVLTDPLFGRAWYNLGLAHAQLNALNDAAEALKTAERLMPESTDPPYALATVMLRQKDMHSARDAVLRALQINPRHQPSRQLLRGLVKPGG